MLTPVLMVAALLVENLLLVGRFKKLYSLTSKKYKYSKTSIINKKQFNPAPI